MGADYPHLLCSVVGPPGSPTTLHTHLGWALQGPTSLIPETNSTFQCHFVAASTKDQLQKDVERLWKDDIIPYSQTSKAAFCLRQDQEALECLEHKQNV